jgi:hypothetical protein
MDARKRDNPDLPCLLKKNSEGEYIWLALILFARPDAMVADEFLKESGDYTSKYSRNTKDGALTFISDHSC